MAAPIIMGYLGKKSGGGLNTNVIGDLLGSFLKTEKKQAPSPKT